MEGPLQQGCCLIGQKFPLIKAKDIESEQFSVKLMHSLHGADTAPIPCG